MHDIELTEEQRMIRDMARAAFEAALDYHRDRVQFEKPNTEHQSVTNMLADMRIRLNASRLKFLHAASLRTADLPCLYESPNSIFSRPRRRSMCPQKRYRSLAVKVIWRIIWWSAITALPGLPRSTKTLAKSSVYWSHASCATTRSEATR